MHISHFSVLTLRIIDWSLLKRGFPLPLLGCLPTLAPYLTNFSALSFPLCFVSRVTGHQVTKTRFGLASVFRISFASLTSFDVVEFPSLFLGLSDLTVYASKSDVPLNRFLAQTFIARHFCLEDCVVHPQTAGEAVLWFGSAHTATSALICPRVTYQMSSCPMVIY